MSIQIEFLIKSSEKNIKVIKEMFEYIKSTYNFPLTISSFNQIKQRDYPVLDTIAYRFLKTQSILGEKLFRKILEYSEYDTTDKSYIEILNELEREGILDVYEWKKLRNLRNNLAHDYPYDEQLIVDTLNDLYYEIEFLENIIKKIKERYEKISEIKRRRD
jgi:hypothetical protein